MINRENFIKILDALRMQHEQEMKFGKALEDFFDGHIVFKLNGKIYDQISSALEFEVCADDSEDWLSWWMWDQDFGRSNNPPARWNGIDYILKTAGDLYDFLRLCDEDH